MQTVMQVIDSLLPGGAEHMAVKLANRAQHLGFESHLCVTRLDGPLAGAITTGVQRLDLQRSSRLSLGAVAKLRRYCRHHDVRVLHAHSSSLFTAWQAALGTPMKLLWHDHYGQPSKRPGMLYRRLLGRAQATIAVNPEGAAWHRSTLGIPTEHVFVLDNWVAPNNEPPASLPGVAGNRIVCVANFRRQKRHDRLLRAFAQLPPHWHLLLVGIDAEAEATAQVHQLRQQLALEARCHLLGQRADVPAILRACEIGVLASDFEGLPLALLEYGAAGLPTLVTNVGGCSAVVEHQTSGYLCAPEDQAFAAALRALTSCTERAALGTALQAKVCEAYGPAGADSLLQTLYAS